jgi:F0F1-type ATP synthase assembly protein I
MIAFITGFLISAIASVPALLMAVQKRGAEFQTRLKLWVIGSAIRFIVIGIFLLLLFKLTDIHRILTVFGVIAAYFISFIIEVYLANRQIRSE